MARKRPTETAPTWHPPRGIGYALAPDRPSPFLLIWRADGIRHKQSFSSEADREAAAKALVDKKAEHGRAVLDFDPQEWARWRQFRATIGNADLAEVARAWLLRAESGAGGASLPVGEAWARFERIRPSEGRLCAGAWAHIRKQVGQRFVGAFGSRRLADINADLVRGWLVALRADDGAELGSNAKLDHLKNVRAFLERCKLEGWCERNPCDLVRLPPAEEECITVIPISDAVAFFAANRDEPFVIRTALEAFGGLRASTAGRIGWANINFAERGIEMPGAIHKSGKRKFRQGQPENLWAWLGLASEATHPTWQMTDRQYAEEKMRGAVRARVEIPRNGWRHSFASYLLAKTKSLPTVGYLMQHSSTRMTEHYEGRATEKDAASYFGIMPENLSAKK